MSLYEQLEYRYGTIRAAARVLGLPEQRVYKWRIRGTPKKYKRIIELALSRGVPSELQPELSEAAQ